ncbi:hypothetical protein A1OK_15160 [Enterovibrio norvegicus FF-454]|uniref:N-acetyltransferase domain-containing protein n=1 Tax=Enterovibrio norvegicus FF-454 TaxID=1185651 RepID=A0A1E5C0E4_9GAMM|nr:GNAT family N-acetyltransferase [Enterovibrio norvegicus]OEE58592.1 hypothetical protein A1OK_15160 [Enterovibrio norvegicus FF-454]
MKIRVAVEDDLERICVLANQINQHHHENEPKIFAKPGNVLDECEFWRSKICGDGTAVLVVEADSIVHGFVLAVLAGSPSVPFLEKTRVCRIGTIVVSDEYQNVGIGKQLLAKAERWAKEQGVSEIRLEVMEFNEAARGFYDKLGFRTQSRVLSKTIV